jgi:hypothetical protein
MFARRSVRKRLVGIAGALALTVGLVLSQGMTSPASAVELIQDGGFEAGASGDSPSWTEADSIFGTPLCTAAACGNGGGTATPHAGTVFAWFGGSATAGHTGSLSQAVTIPSGPASLTYFYRNGSVSAPFDATLTVKVDGTTVKTHTEAAVAEAGYTQQTVDLAAFANGASHTISFEYLNGGAGGTNMTIDNVSINIDSEAPQTTITSSPVGGIAKSLTVPIGFTSSETPSTFSCKVDTGAAAACTSPKSITVTPGVHTFSVAATDALNNTDATPATVTFTAYDCTALNAAVAKAQKSVAKAKKALKKAKKSGNAAKIAKAKKKLKKAKKALKKAKAAAAPCGSTPKVVSGAAALRK